MANLIMNGVNLGPVIKVDELPTTNINEHAVYEITCYSLTEENPIGPSLAVGAFWINEDAQKSPYDNHSISFTLYNPVGGRFVGWYNSYPYGISNVEWQSESTMINKYMIHYNETILDFEKGPAHYLYVPDFVQPYTEGKPEDECIVSLWDVKDKSLKLFSRTSDVDDMIKKYSELYTEYYHYDVVNEVWVRIDECPVFTGSTATENGSSGLVPDSPENAHSEGNPLSSTGKFENAQIILVKDSITSVNIETFKPLFGLPFHHGCGYMVVGYTKTDVSQPEKDEESVDLISGMLKTYVYSYGYKYICAQRFISPENTIDAIRTMTVTKSSEEPEYEYFTEDIATKILEVFDGGYYDSRWKNVTDDTAFHGTTWDGIVLPSSKQRQIGWDGDYIYSPRYFSESVLSWISEDGTLYSNLGMYDSAKSLGEQMFIPQNEDLIYRRSFTASPSTWATGETIGDLASAIDFGKRYKICKNSSNFENVTEEPEIYTRNDILYIVDDD